MKLQYDIQYYNPDMHNELSSIRENSFRDISMSPFLMENEKKADKKTIEKDELIRNIKKFSDIVNEDILKSFMLQCLIVDTISIFFTTFELIESTMQITTFFPCILCFLEFISIIFNIVFDLDFLILQSENKNSQNSNIESHNNNKKKIKKHPADSDIYVYLTPTNALLGRMCQWKFWLWLIEYTIIILFIYTVNHVQMINYIPLFLKIVQYNQYKMCQFYYQTILRFEYNQVKMDKMEANLN